MKIVDLPGVEREQPRLALLDDADLYTTDDRQLLAPVGDNVRRIAGLEVGGVDIVAIAGIRREHDLAAALPFVQHECVGADRMVHHAARDRIAIFLDDLACDRSHRHCRNLLDQQVIRLHEP